MEPDLICSVTWALIVNCAFPHSRDPLATTELVFFWTSEPCHNSQGLSRCSAVTPAGWCWSQGEIHTAAVDSWCDSTINRRELIEAFLRSRKNLNWLFTGFPSTVLHDKITFFSLFGYFIHFNMKMPWHKGVVCPTPAAYILQKIKSTSWAHLKNIPFVS